MTSERASEIRRERELLERESETRRLCVCMNMYCDSSGAVYVTAHPDFRCLHFAYGSVMGVGLHRTEDSRYIAANERGG